MKKDEIYNRYIHAAGRFAEAIRLPEGSYAQPLLAQCASDVLIGAPLSQLLGKAMAGQRVSAVLDSALFKEEVSVLQSCCLHHVPLTLVAQVEDGDAIQNIVKSGAIVFYSEPNMLEAMLQYAQVLSERALLPVVLILASNNTKGEITSVSDDVIAKWLGESRDAIDSPTASQTLVFGPQRRRIPRYIQRSSSVLLNAVKLDELRSLQLASNKEFFEKDYAVLIEETAKEYEELSGINIPRINNWGAKRPKRCVLGVGWSGADFNKDTLKYFKKKDIAFYSINQLQPLPAELLDGVWKEVQVLEPLSSANYPWGHRIKAQMKQTPAVFQMGYYVGSPTSQSILLAAKNLADGGESNFYLNIPLTLGKSNFPKHQVLIQHMQRIQPNLQQKMMVKPEIGSLTGVPQVPNLVGKLSNSGATYTMAGRFNDDTILPIKMGSELVADPFQAFNITPAATSFFIDRSGNTNELPVFSPAHCNDIQALVNSCSHAAMPSTLFTIKQWLEELVKVKRPNGEGLRHIMPIKGKLTKALRAVALKGEVSLMADWLLAAAEELVKENTDLKEEVDVLAYETAGLPVVFDSELYHAAEKQNAGSGLVFCVAVNPFACTACGDCVLVGQSACMEMQPKEKVLESLTDNFKSFMKQPTVETAALEAMLARSEDPFATLLFDKEGYHLFGGSSTSEMQEHEALVRHQLQVCELQMRPKRIERLEAVKQLLGQLNDGIRSSLGDSLPVRQLDELGAILEGHSEERLDMQQFFDEWGSKVDFKPLDRTKLERKLGLVEALGWWKQQLEGGDRYPEEQCAVVVDESLDSMVEYPYNPFKAPAVRAKGTETIGVVLGLAQAFETEHVASARLLKKAELEVQGNFVPAIHNKELEAMEWGDLSTEEQQAAPPILLFASTAWLYACGANELATLLNSEYPIRILIVDNGVSRADNVLEQIELRSNAMWPLIAQNKALVGQLSLADPQLVYNTMQRAMSYSGCSLLNVLVPDATGFDVHQVNWRALSHLAVSSRSFLEWVYDPSKGGRSVASKIDTYVPEISTNIIRVNIQTEDGEVEYPMTFADWAFMQKALRNRLVEVAKGEEHLLMDSYLALSAKERKQYTPVILRQEADAWVYYAVDSVLVEACDRVNQKLDVLREWAGLYTAYPEKLEHKVKEELRTEYEAKQKKFEDQLIQDKRAWEENYLNEVRAKMRETLLDLSGM